MQAAVYLMVASRRSLFLWLNRGPIVRELCIMPSDHEDTFHGMSFILNLKHGRILCIRHFLLDGIVFCKHTVAMEGQWIPIGTHSIYSLNSIYSSAPVFDSEGILESL